MKCLQVASQTNVIETTLVDEYGKINRKQGRMSSAFGWRKISTQGCVFSWPDELPWQAG
jgi:hypothetical protein